MPLPILIRKVFNRGVVPIDTYLSESFHCPKMHYYQLLYRRHEIQYPDSDSDPLAIHIDCLKDIQPFGITFGSSKNIVRKALGSPFLSVNNNTNIPGHIILLYKRKIGYSKTTTQVHLVNNRVTLVYEQFARAFMEDTSFFSQTLISLGLQIPAFDKGSLIKDKLPGLPGPLVFTDSKGRIIRAEESVTINVLFQTK